MNNLDIPAINKIKNLAPKLSYIDRLELCEILLDEDNYHVSEEEILSSTTMQKIIFNKKEIKKNLAVFHKFAIRYLPATLCNQFSIILPIYQKALNQDDFNQHVLAIIRNKEYYSDHFNNEAIASLAEFKHLYSEETFKEIMKNTSDLCFTLESIIPPEQRHQYIDKKFIRSFVHKYSKHQIEGFYYLKRNQINTQDSHNQNSAFQSLLFIDIIEARCQRLLKLVFSKEQIAQILTNNFNYYLIKAMSLSNEKESNIIFNLMKQHIKNNQLKTQLKNFITLKKAQKPILNDILKIGDIHFKKFKTMYEFFKDELLEIKLTNPYKQILYFYKENSKTVKSILGDYYRYSDEYYDYDENLDVLVQEKYDKDFIEFEALSLIDEFNTNVINPEKNKKVRKI